MAKTWNKVVTTSPLDGADALGDDGGGAVGAVDLAAAVVRNDNAVDPQRLRRRRVLTGHDPFQHELQGIGQKKTPETTWRKDKHQINTKDRHRSGKRKDKHRSGKRKDKHRSGKINTV